WPPGAAGLGYTLERITPSAFGDDPINWRAGGIYGASSNVPPVFTQTSPQAVTIDEDGTPVAFSLALNASDANSDALTWSIVTPAAHGNAAVNGAGTSMQIAYNP